MKNLILTLIITIPLTLVGQGWEQTYGGTSYDGGNSVQQTQDGGYIITGQTYSFGNGNSDVYLVKTDGNGNELWSQTFGGTSLDIGYSIQQTLDGGYIICGEIVENGNRNVYLIKTDGNGNELWSQTFGGINDDHSYSVQQTLDGGYIITGETSSFGNGQFDVWLIKTDSNGSELWNKTFGGTSVDYCRSGQQTTDGGYIITGWSNYGSGSDVHLIKTDENGDEIWTNTYGGISSDEGWSVQQTTDGGYIVTGRTSSFGNGNYDVYLIKTDGNGNELWTKIYGGINGDMGNSVTQTSDGGYLICGQTRSFGNGEYDVYLIKTDDNGNELWTKTFGGSYNDSGRDVKQTQDGGYIVTGFFCNWGSTPDVYLIKTDDQGNITSTIEIPLPNPDRKLEKTINLKGQEIKPQTGQPIIEIFDDGSVEKKLIFEK